jgi:hypothetical protein
MARSILHAEYKWRKFVLADNSSGMSDMYEGWDINYGSLMVSVVFFSALSHI